PCQIDFILEIEADVQAAEEKQCTRADQRQSAADNPADRIPAKQVGCGSREKHCQNEVRVGEAALEHEIAAGRIGRGRAGSEVQDPVEEEPCGGEQLEFGYELHSPCSPHPVR